MVRAEEIIRVADEIAREFHPERACRNLRFVSRRHAILASLLQQTLVVERLWARMAPALKPLGAAVQYRYPGISGSKQDTKTSIDIAKELRVLARRSLGI